jgi:hypothetical protein
MINPGMEAKEDPGFVCIYVDCTYKLDDEAQN